MTDYRRRALGGPAREALSDLPVVVVTGLRQTGKSTFLRNERGLARRRYVSLDDFAQLAAARSDPESFVRGEEALTVDEAQRCPELLAAVKREVDRDRTPGRFLLSGSANFALLRGMSESLAGRALYLTLDPFTRREIRGSTEGAPFLRRMFEAAGPPKSVRFEPIELEEILRGGLPPVCLEQVRKPSLWFKGYEQTYLERDVRELSRVGDLVAFRDLLHLVALRTAQVLSVSQLGRDAKLNATTAARYLSLLEASFVIRRIPPFLANRASRLIKAAKLYVSDSGLAAHLCRVDRALARSDPLWGALLETYVAQNLAGILDSEWPGASLSYWHIQGRYEVDFIIDVGRDCFALEVKSSRRWEERDLAGLRAFLEKTKRCRAAVLAYAGDDVVRLGERLWAVPLALALS